MYHVHCDVCTMYTVMCVPCTLLCTMYTVMCVPCTLLCTMYTVMCVPCILCVLCADLSLCILFVYLQELSTLCPRMNVLLCMCVCVLLQEPNKGAVVAFSGYGYDQDNLEKLWSIDRYVCGMYVLSIGLLCA